MYIIFVWLQSVQRPARHGLGCPKFAPKNGTNQTPINQSC